MHAVLSKRDSNGIADSIVEERTDTDGTLDASVFSFTRFGHSKMDWVIPVIAFLRQARGEQPIGIDHYLRVARLHGKNDCVVVEVSSNSGEFERTFDHPERSVAVTVHDAIGERTVIRPDPHCDSSLPAQPNEWSKAFPDPFQLRCILFIGVFDDLEFFRIRVIPGIDSYFFH